MSGRKYVKGESAAKRLLRQEVGFGCPICRKPFLEYHHFDPPWHVRHHWDPEGIIALCAEHHYEAEGGRWTKDELRELKSASYSVVDIKERFWSRPTEACIVRVGGLYSCGSRAVIRVDNEPVIEIGTADDGRLSVSFVLRASDGSLVARMVDNVFEGGSTAPFDLYTTVKRTRITVWHAVRSVGLDVSLEQVRPEKLDQVLAADRERQGRKLDPVYSELQGQLAATLAHLPAELADEILEVYDSGTTLRSPEEAAQRVREFRERFGASKLPDRLLQACFSGDPVGELVKSWADSKCTDTDGLISFLNFENLLLHGKDREIRIRNGVGDLDYNAVFDCDTAFAF